MRQLTDTCVKNGGAHFFSEIASREFMDNLTSLLKASGPAALNEEVKGRVLELIQAWSTGAEARPNAGYIVEVYRSLQREGFHFPPKVDVASSMFESNAVSLVSVIWTKLLLTRNSSLQSGPTRMYVCAVERSLPLRTGSITAGTAETSSAVLAPANRSLYLISGSCSL